MTEYGPQPVDRRLPTEEARDLMTLVRELARARDPARGRRGGGRRALPARDLHPAVGSPVCSACPYDEEFGGGDQPYEVYLQVLEELAAARLTVGLGVSVHTLACHALAGYGSKEQRAEHLPGHARRRAPRRVLPLRARLGLRRRLPDHPGRPGRRHWTLNGTKAWITHGGVADFYTVLARTGGSGPAASPPSWSPATPRG